jgi:hypothetical protein
MVLQAIKKGMSVSLNLGYLDQEERHVILRHLKAGIVRKLLGFLPGKFSGLGNNQR